MDSRKKAEHLIARAKVLKSTLAKNLRDLDPDLLQRFAATVLELGIIDDDQLKRIFEVASANTLSQAYSAFALDSADMESLPVALARINQEYMAASATLAKDLGEKARLALQSSVDRALREGWSVARLSRVVKDQIGLTAQQNQWVRNFERDLRSGKPGAGIDRQLRDRRFDPSVLRGDIPEQKIQRMVQRYREKWINYRSTLIARQELLKGSHSANNATWMEADARGQVPLGVRKFWIDLEDTKVRHSHHMISILNPNGVGIQEAFVTPLGRLRYPCDPMGVAEDVVGCRCSMIFDTSNPERRS